MNKRIRAIVPFLAVIGCLLILTQGCSKQNEPQALVYDFLKPKVGSPEYYEALRAYKKSDHAIAFGWWGQSGVNDISSNMTSRYEGLPDSMDIVSLWGGIPEVGSPVWNEMQKVREKKGTKFIFCMFGSGVERLMKKNDSANFVNDKLLAIENVAKEIADIVSKYKIDGFDLDYEPNFGDRSIFGYGPKDNGGCIYTQNLMKSLSKYMGPKADNDLVLVMDGAGDYEPGVEPYIDFYAYQAYSDFGSGFNSYQIRFNQTKFLNLPSKKIILTDNMQKFGPRGASLIYQGEDIGTILGMAIFNPKQGRKGGFGGYIIEADAISNPSQGLYYYLRRGIQIQNPAPY